MPGHKRNRHFFACDFLDMDLTEFSGMDVLSAPTGILGQFQTRLADIFKSDESFFLVNGASAGVIAAICAVCDAADSGDKPLFIPRNAHISAYRGLILSGGTPAYYMPEITDCGLAGGVRPEVFQTMPQGAAALVVSPTYEGFVSDIASIANIVHDRGGILIVDEAHGAHFGFHQAFPATAMRLGADISVNSLHKTLPAPGQTAVLHVQGQRIHRDKLKFYIDTMQTTSPSYAFMGACDFMLEKIQQAPELFDTYVSLLTAFRNNLTGMAIHLYGLAIRGNAGIFDLDIGKLLFKLNTPKHIEAEAIASILTAQYKIQMEMAKGRHLLAMTSVADTAEGFERLLTAIKALNKELPTGDNPKQCAIENFSLPTVEMTPREALSRQSKTVPCSEAVGKISAELIAEYPPGIVMVAPGERIVSEILHRQYVRIIE